MAGDADRESKGKWSKRRPATWIVATIVACLAITIVAQRSSQLSPSETRLPGEWSFALTDEPGASRRIRDSQRRRARRSEGVRPSSDPRGQRHAEL